jgi:hypothetical protein
MQFSKLIKVDVSEKLCKSSLAQISWALRFLLPIIHIRSGLLFCNENPRIIGLRFDTVPEPLLAASGSVSDDDGSFGYIGPFRHRVVI